LRIWVQESWKIELWIKKIWALEAFKGKTFFSGGSKEFLEVFFEWLKGLGAKYRGSCKIWGFLRNFCGVFGDLGPIYKYLSKTEGLL
jgi:hypothetical protein